MNIAKAEKKIYWDTNDDDDNDETSNIILFSRLRLKFMIGKNIQSAHSQTRLIYVHFFWRFPSLSLSLSLLSFGIHERIRMQIIFMPKV